MALLWQVVLFVIVLHIVDATYSNLKSDSGIKLKRAYDEPEWDSLGWSWGKRSAPTEFPRRFLRSLHPVKKNPEWDDLGWTWGRR